MKRLSIPLAATICALVVVSSADAAVLGRRHIGAGVGLTWVGDGHVDDTSLDFSARIRLPIGRHFDVVAFHGQALLEGADDTLEGAPYVKSKRTEYGVELICHFSPQRTADPFLSAGVSNATVATTVDGTPTYADEDLRFQVGGGAELRLARNVSLNLGLAYRDSFRARYDNEVTAGISVNGWVTDLILIGVALDGSFDTGDTSATVRVSYGF